VTPRGATPGIPPILGEAFPPDPLGPRSGGTFPPDTPLVPLVGDNPDLGDSSPQTPSAPAPGEPSPGHPLVPLGTPLVPQRGHALAPLG